MGHGYPIRLKQVMCGDSLEIMGRLDDKSVGAIITDPSPLTIRRQIDPDDPWQEQSSIEVALAQSFPFIAEFKRLLRRGGSLVIICDPRSIAAWVYAAEEAEIPWMGEVIVLWNTGVVRDKNFSPLHSHVLWFVAPGAQYTWNSERRYIASNLIVCRRIPPHYRHHPSQKPIELTTFLVSLLTKTDDTILDPFCGTGSTLVSAAIAGRPYIGIDSNSRMCELAERRARNFEAEEDDSIYLWYNGRMEEI